MGKYWRQTYLLQLAAVGLMFLAMPLEWDRERGTGLQVLDKALTTTIAIGLNPFDPDHIPVSQWWLVWVIPGIGVILALRAVNGLIFKQLEGQTQFLRLMVLLLSVALAWYIATFYEILLVGFWLEVVAVGVLLGAVWVELMLPVAAELLPSWFIEPVIEEVAEASSAPTEAPVSPICPACGALNALGATTCQICGRRLG